MPKTPNIGLTLTPESDDQKTFLTFRTELAGDGADSNMLIIDTEIEDINGKLATMDEMIEGIATNAQSSVIFAAEQPESQDVGGVWNKMLA
jgi:hypothetical protein